MIHEDVESSEGTRRMEDEKSWRSDETVGMCWKSGFSRTRPSFHVFQNLYWPPVGINSGVARRMAMGQTLGLSPSFAFTNRMNLDKQFKFCVLFPHL